MVEAIRMVKMAAGPMETTIDAIISGKIDSLEKLKPFAGNVMMWLKESLLQAHQDDELKKRIKLLLGTHRFTSNLKHLGLWDDLIQHSKSKALVLGVDMQTYFVDANLGTVLGNGAVSNTFGKFEQDKYGLRHVVECNQAEGVRRQDATLPMVFPFNPAYSQLWNEQCFIHCIRMIAMAIDVLFQTLVSGVCTTSKGAFRGCAIKGFVRMLNKCISPDDHYWEAFPRPSLNIDLNRNACTFKCPEDLLMFIKKMKEHPMIGSIPVRIKNMFLFDDERAEKQFFYRTVMINWLYTPGITYGELAGQAKPLWEAYFNFQNVSWHEKKDPSESWGTWRKQIGVAVAYLTNPELKDKQVQFIVETQLLLHPYLIGRQHMHLLYKICRADDPDALYSDFRATFEPETCSFEEFQDTAQSSMKAFAAETGDVNRRHQELNGATRLWQAAEKGQHKAVSEILQHPKIDPNKVREDTQTTPLYIAAHRGHVKVVKALLGHSKIQVNLGKIDTEASPLFAAAQEGREEVVVELLQAGGIDINQTTKKGTSSLSVACGMGHEHVVGHLLAGDAIDVDATLENLAPGRTKILESIMAHCRKGGRLDLVKDFPSRYSYYTDVAYYEAVSTWAHDTAANRAGSQKHHDSENTNESRPAEGTCASAQTTLSAAAQRSLPPHLLFLPGYVLASAAL